MELLIFITLSVMAVSGAFLTVLHPRAVNSAMSLVLTMMSLAGIYLLLHAHLVAILQIIVYAGAIMVLILFVIMLLGEEEKLANQKKHVLFAQLFGVLALSAVFLGISLSLRKGPNTAFSETPPVAAAVESAPGSEIPVTLSDEEKITHERALAISAEQEFGTVKAVGRLLFSRYVLAFEVISMVLLAAIVGAVLLARRRLN